MSRPRRRRADALGDDGAMFLFKLFIATIITVVGTAALTIGFAWPFGGALIVSAIVGVALAYGLPALLDGLDD
jgi:hypothetical protein